MITITTNGGKYEIDTVELTVSEEGFCLEGAGMGYSLQVEGRTKISDPSAGSAVSSVELSGRATRPDGKGLEFTSSSTSKVEEF